MTKVINSYHPNFSGGIGDFLRGSLYLLDKCGELGYDFEIDFKHHPINDYMYTDCEDVYHIASIIDVEKVSISKQSDLDNWAYENEDTLHSILDKSNGVVALSSLYSDIVSHQHRCEELGIEFDNIKYIEKFEVSESGKKFIRDNIKFSDDVKSVERPDDYEVIHFRLGDRLTVKGLDKSFDKLPSFIQDNYNFQKFDINFENLLEICRKHLDQSEHKNLIVMSDSNDFKKYILDNNTDERIIVTHTHSSHTSKQPALICLTNFESTIKNEDMFYTALDIYTLSQSKRNTSYSVYAWGSGFVCWISKVFNIPLSLESLA